MDTIACNRGYFTNGSGNGALVDVVEAKVDDVAKTVTFYFPYPFQILGLAFVDIWEVSPPVSEIPMNLEWRLMQTVDQEFNYFMLLQMFSVMMYANRDYGNYPDSPFLGAIKYEEEGTAKFRNYFANKLNSQLKTIYYNEFLANPSLIRKFWQDQLAIANPNGVQQALLELADRLFNYSDRRLWGAPGKYTVYYGDSAPTPPYQFINTYSMVCPIPSPLV